MGSMYRMQLEKNYGVHVGCGGPCGQEGIGGKENNE